MSWSTMYWKYGWIDEWLGGWIDEWLGGWIDGWLGGWIDGWLGGWMAAANKELEIYEMCKDGRIDGRLMNEMDG